LKSFASAAALAEARKRFRDYRDWAPTGPSSTRARPVHVFFGGQIIAVRDVRGRQAAVIVDRLTEGRVGPSVSIFSRA